MTVKINGTNSVANPAFTGADTDTGLQCGTNEVKLVTGGTARATVDSSGNLGLGTTSPAEELHINGSTPSIRLSDTAGSNLITRITNSNGDLYFDADFGGSTGDFIFRTNGEKMRIAANGAIKLASGCLGIDFSQIQTNAAGMYSETLDSYEEGTWTPSITPGAGAITSMHGTVGRYIKVGRSVYAHFGIHINDSGTAAGSYMTIHGLPFVSVNGGVVQQGTIREQNVNGFLYNINLGANTTAAAVHRYDNAGVIVTGGNYHGSITYEVA